MLWNQSGINDEMSVSHSDNEESDQVITPKLSINVVFITNSYPHTIQYLHLGLSLLMTALSACLCFVTLAQLVALRFEPTKHLNHGNADKIHPSMNLYDLCDPMVALR
jgi:hypothetical protein